MPHLSLFLLGAFEARLDGELVTAFGTDKARALLAYLAVESDRPHRRSELAGMFWPDAPEKKAAHNLSQTLLRLRGTLREPKAAANAARQPFLLLTAQDLQFNPQSDFNLDVASFAELLRACRRHHHPDAQTCPACMQWLRQAAALYRGDLLAGFFLRGCVGFEEWELVQQERLHRQAVEVLARLAAYHEGRGEQEWVQRYAGRLVALEPWNEQGHLQMMRALSRQGQAAAALEQYAAYTRVLAEEFGFGPSSEAAALFRQIQSGQLGKEAAPKLHNGPASTGQVTPVGGHIRGQVTALVCSPWDPAGRGDPEGSHQRMARCRATCQAILECHGGHRQQRHGDECLIYFGYPLAHEDAARRAVRAGLALVAASEETGPIRIGIHTGDMVVAGGHGPEVEAREPAGDVPGVARGCLGLAEPGTVLITASTERLVHGWFRCQELGQRTLPGQDRTAEVCQVLGESDVQSRLDCLALGRDLTPFVGREDELSRLLALAGRLPAGRGQVVLIRGEPGIGKSRLLWELEARLQAASHSAASRWLESHCSPYFQNTGLYPIIRLLERLLGFGAGNAPEVKRDRLDTMLTYLGLDWPGASWLLSLLLGLPTDPPAPQTITPDQRERMREVSVALLQRQAERRPLVVVVEDLHWSDPATVEWLGRSFDSLAAVPCLLLLTCRPTFVCPWPPSRHLHSLTLGPLSPGHAGSIVSSVAGAVALSDEVRRSIVQRSDGVPLFVEELTRAILEPQTLETSTAATALRIPAPLRDPLRVRLEHAGAAMETAQWAAVLGREFSYSILRAVVPFDEQRLLDDLEVLVEADLVNAQDRSSDARLAFRHTLIQEAAYASLLKSTRQDHHRRIAEALEAHFPHVVETQPEVVAEHYACAGLPAQAIDFWLRAGERATAQGAVEEATAFFDRALAHIGPLDGARRWQALLGRETVLFYRGDRAAQQADVTALLDLADALDDDALRAQALLRRARFAGSQADFQGQLGAGQAAAVAAGHAAAPALEVEALAYQMTALMRLDDWAAALKAVERTQALLQEVQDDSARAYASAAVALYYSELGDLARAAQSLIQSLESARQSPVRQLDRESQYHGHLGVTYANAGFYAQARDTLLAGLELVALAGSVRSRAYLMFNLGFVYLHTGDLDAAARAEEQALASFSAIGEAYGRAGCQAMLACIHEAAGSLALAAEYGAAACAGYAEIGLEADRFDAQATRAHMALRLGQPDEARELALEVWRYLREHGTEGMATSAEAYSYVADVVEAAGAPGVTAREVIEAGYRELMRRSEMISDPDWRRSFLENVPENRAIVERWKEIGAQFL